MKHRVCLTTFIAGEKYQDYIPMLIFSIKKSYPDYGVVIFVNKSLKEELKEVVSRLSAKFTDTYVIENTFDDCPTMNPITAQSLRWVVWTDLFSSYEYLYYIDADIFYIKEPLSLGEQHIAHMNFIGDPGISNIVRCRDSLKGMLTGLYINYSYGGWPCIFDYFGNRFVYRMSGIHFVKTSSYFNLVNEEVRNHFKKIIYEQRISKVTKFADNEALLYNMIKYSGWNMSAFSIQKTSTSMFGFNNPCRGEFCPHHGIHMGIFRREIAEIKPFAINQLESDDYKYYVSEFQEHYLKDPTFKYLYNSLPYKLRIIFDRFFEYYKISFS